MGDMSNTMTLREWHNQQLYSLRAHGPGPIRQAGYDLPEPDALFLVDIDHLADMLPAYVWIVTPATVLPIHMLRITVHPSMGVLLPEGLVPVPLVETPLVRPAQINLPVDWEHPLWVWSFDGPEVAA